MVIFLSVLLALLALLIALPVAWLLVEVIAATLPLRNASAPISGIVKFHGRVAVLIPAHNESSHLIPTLNDVKAQIPIGGRVLVVADNCTDDTASVAGAAGVEVVERTDPDKRGKGYALAWGISCLAADPPDVVIIIDADCRLGVLAIGQLVAACVATRRPVQARYLMLPPVGSAITSRVAEFAWRLKNWVRPSGLSVLHLPCQLVGSGMAFPWTSIRSVDLANGLLVEDLKLGLDLALVGNSPLFCSSATITSYFPSSAAAVETQRLRWMRGYIEMIITATPRLMFYAARRADLNLLVLALDLMIPPITLLGMLLIATPIVAGLATLLGISGVPTYISLATLSAFIIALFISWLNCGRDILPLQSMLLIVHYVAERLPLYRKIMSRKSAAQWIRTARK